MKTGIFTYIWPKLMVNVGKYSMHGAYGFIIVHGVWVAVLHHDPLGAGRVLATGIFFFTNEARFLIEESESRPQSFPWRALVVSVCTKLAPRNQLLE